ncbi:hypothetical protein CCAN12_810102 [Capnocytophaga canimorsus]|uniref:Uncharacterized protein n=1 Tax=Capnocytophaga canimorsus TaxID=28188 RepID=A0A0B7HQJ6_9FLAO|nr:hypothetical protein CCAN12_810102 [Capnocytophaga canimorsus]
MLVFEPPKIKWFNHQYLQQKPVNELAEDFRKILEEKNIKTENAVIEKVIQLIRERASL